MRAIKKIEAQTRDIHTAGQVLKGVWSVRVEDIIRTENFPYSKAEMVREATNRMRVHAGKLSKALTAGAKNEALTILYDRTKILYEGGIRNIEMLQELPAVRKVLAELYRIVPAVGFLEHYAAGGILRGQYPLVLPDIVEEKQRIETPSLHWEAHSEMMKTFAEFQARYRTELKEIVRTRRAQ